MLHSTHPRIRPHVVKEVNWRPGSLRPGPHQGRTSAEPRSYQLVDRLGLAAPLSLSTEELTWLDWFDGTHSLADMQRKGCKSRTAPATLDLSLIHI